MKTQILCEINCKRETDKGSLDTLTEALGRVAPESIVTTGSYSEESKVYTISISSEDLTDFDVMMAYLVLLSLVT